MIFMIMITILWTVLILIMIMTMLFWNRLCYFMQIVRLALRIKLMIMITIMRSVIIWKTIMTMIMFLEIRKCYRMDTAWWDQGDSGPI